MKKAVLIAIAALMMAAPMAQAQTWHHDDRRPAQHHVFKKNTYKKVVVKKHWKRGERMSDWRRHNEIRDYKRYGLRKPGHNQRWVKVDNDYVLISIASGLIAGIIAAQ
ncbi:RcnB family protein [Pseudomonas sp. R2.Fl]|nr:RcnB family protein [Pseudomonas sp. R2.Fl]